MNCFRIFIALIICNPLNFCQNDTLTKLQVAVKLTDKGKAVHNFTISVFNEGKCIDTILVVNSNPKYIDLKTNKTYTVFYKSNDSLEKIIIVNTKLPENISKKIKGYKVQIQVELDHTYSKQKDDAYDFPSAIIKYNEKSKNFDYVKNYHKQVHK